MADINTILGKSGGGGNSTNPNPFGASPMDQMSPGGMAFTGATGYPLPNPSAQPGQPGWNPNATAVGEAMGALPNTSSRAQTSANAGPSSMGSPSVTIQQPTPVGHGPGSAAGR